VGKDFTVKQVCLLFCCLLLLFLLFSTT
jgi:hypothetical protein